MRRTAAALALVLALAACGGDDDTTGPAIQPEGEADLAGAYDVAYTICEGIGAGEIEPDPSMSADPDDHEAWAFEYAADYEPPFRDVYHDGCLDGFAGRPKNPPS